MSLKKLENDTDRAYWESVEKAAKEWRERQPSWSRELERERPAKPADTNAASGPEHPTPRRR